MKETIFISSLTILFIFYSFYCIANPTFINPMTIGVISGFIIEVVVIALLAGVNVVSSGLSDVSIKAIGVIGTIVNILFQIRIEAGSPENIVLSILKLPLGIFAWLLPHAENGSTIIGMGILYPVAYDIFVVPNMGLLGYIGYIFISGLSVLTLVSGILIAFGGASTN